jgi:hypothetical protein
MHVETSLDSFQDELRAAVPEKHVDGVKSSLAYSISETASATLMTCRWLRRDTFVIT